MNPDAHQLLVTTAADRRFAIRRIPDGTLVFDDVDRQEGLGPVIGDLAAFYVELTGEPYVIFAAAIGDNEGPVHRVDLKLTDGDQHRRMCNGVWMSHPVPFEPGMRVNATWRDEGDRALRQRRTPPLQRRDLQPHPDADWTGYASA